MGRLACDASTLRPVAAGPVARLRPSCSGARYSSARVGDSASPESPRSTARRGRETPATYAWSARSTSSRTRTRTTRTGPTARPSLTRSWTPARAAPSSRLACWRSLGDISARADSGIPVVEGRFSSRWHFRTLVRPWVAPQTKTPPAGLQGRQSISAISHAPKAPISVISRAAPLSWHGIGPRRYRLTDIGGAASGRARARRPLERSER